MSGHRDAFSEPEISVTDQIELLKFLLLVHVCEVVKVVLDLIAKLV